MHIAVPKANRVGRSFESIIFLAYSFYFKEENPYLGTSLFSDREWLFYTFLVLGNQG
jgi:hypothetical protein